MSQEEWRDVKDYEGLYQVSNIGRVKSLSRRVPCRIGFRVSPAKMIKPILMPNGYLRASLCKNGKCNHFFIHRLVAIAFINNPEHKRCVNHLNENKSDNRLINLEWATHGENLKYSRDRVINKSSHQSRNKKIDECRALTIFTFEGHFTHEKIAKYMKLKVQVVRKLLSGLTFSHVYNSIKANQ